MVYGYIGAGIVYGYWGSAQRRDCCKSLSMLFTAQFHDKCFALRSLSTMNFFEGGIRFMISVEKLLA